MVSLIDLIPKIIAAFFNENPILLLFNVLNVLYLIPAILAVLNFRYVRSYDYLIIAGMLAFNAISTLILDVVLVEEMWVSFLPLAQLLWTIFLILTNLALITYWLHLIRLKWETPPKVLWYGFGVYFLVNHVIFFFSYRLLVKFDIITPDPTLVFIQSTLQFASIMTCGLFFIFVYRTFIPVIEYNPVKNAIRLWQIVGGFFALLGGFVVTVTTIIYLEIEPLYFLLDIPAYEVFWIPASIFILIITFRYPEALLISQAQVRRACKLYVKLVVHEQIPESKHFGFDRIVDYINNIPETTLEKGCQE